MNWSYVYETFCIFIQTVFMTGIIVNLSDKKRISNDYINYAIGITCLFFSGLYNLFGGIYDTAAGSDIRIMLFSFSMFIVAIGVINKDKIWSKIKIFLICVLFPIFVVELPMELFATKVLLPGKPLNDIMYDSVFRIYLRMISLTVCISYSTCLIIVHNRKKIKYFIFCILFLIGIPLVQLVYLTAVFRQEFRSESFMAIGTGAAALILTVFLNLMLLVYVNVNIRVYNREKEQIAIGSINKMNEQYYELVNSEVERTQKIRHDIGNQIEQIEMLFNSGVQENKEIASLMLNEMKIKTNELTRLKYCNNTIVNTVLTLKSEYAKSKSIMMDIKVSVPDTINVSNLDLSSALSNIIDNAIDAVSTLPENIDRTVKIKIEIIENKLFIRVENFSNLKKYIIGVDEMLSVSGNKSPNHGYGLKILLDIASRNNGEFLIENKENKCTSILSIGVG